MLTAIDYWLYARSVDHQPLETFINNTKPPKKKQLQELPPGPVEIDTTINTQAPWEDGLHIRKGWVRN